MDIHDFEPFQGTILKEKIQSLSRSELDHLINQFGGQYATLCQRLEALYAPDRLDRFISIRPGNLAEIDKAIKLTKENNPKELTLLKSFRELNRILQPFMDVYEENVLSDLQHMSKQELEALDTNVAEQLATAQRQLKQAPDDYRQVQNASGTLRLAALMKAAIQEELKRRNGFEII